MLRRENRDTQLRRELIVPVHVKFFADTHANRVDGKFDFVKKAITLSFEVDVVEATPA